MVLLFALIFGLIVGSFLNMVIYRLRSKESMVFPRSHCVHCGHVLSSSDLIPVLSFVNLRGKCRYCRKNISWQYPVVEALTAIVFALLTLKFLATGSGLELFASLVFAGFFIVIAVFDFKHYLILDKVVFLGAGIALIYNISLDFVSGINLFSPASHLVSGVFGALVISGFFLAQFLSSRGRWIGFGDVKFGIFLGLVVGWPLCLILLMIAYVLGAVVGVGLIIAQKKRLSSKLPFGVFLSISAIITMLVGQGILSWYLRLLGM